MRKIAYILREAAYLVRKHRLYILAPILIALAVIALFFFSAEPAPLVIFIYAGV